MVIKSYIIEMGVQIDFETTTTYPTKKVGGNFIELKHLEPLSKDTIYSIKDKGEKHTFTNIEDVNKFLPTTEMYQARLKSNG